MFVFFFKQKTAYEMRISDWSSDVCSSDLRPSANAAAIKAFLVNRVGDVGFALGICGAFVLFGTASFDQIFAAAPDFATAEFEAFGITGHALTIICILLFLGALGKSAPLGLHPRLPDAMEGPTPVSALTHAQNGRPPW